MTSQQYRTRDGDTLDYIANKVYGSTDATEQLIEANRTIADLGVVLPAGVIVELPEIVLEQKKQGVRLWD